MHCEIGGTQGSLGYVSALGTTRLVHWLILVAPSCLRSHNARYTMLKSLNTSLREGSESTRNIGRHVNSPIQIWPSCCFFVPSAARVRFQNRLKSRGGCATKMLRTEIIELFNASNKSTHVLCIDRKLRSFWVEWRSYHICRCTERISWTI